MMRIRTRFVKTRWYKFWIKSRRGTDEVTYVRLPHRMDREDVRDKLEKWCARFPAWDMAGCNGLEFGWVKVRWPPRGWLLKHGLR